MCKKKKKSSNTNDLEGAIHSTWVSQNRQETELSLGTALRRKPMFHLFTTISIIIPHFSPSRQDRSLWWLQGDCLCGPERFGLGDRCEVPAGECVLWGESQAEPAEEGSPLKTSFCYQCLSLLICVPLTSQKLP